MKAVFGNGGSGNMSSGMNRIFTAIWITPLEPGKTWIRENPDGLALFNHPPFCGPGVLSAQLGWRRR